MALVATTAQEICALFDTNIQANIMEICNDIPGSLVKFLEQKQIVTKVNFKQDFSASQIQMGTDKKVNFADFEIAFRRTIKVGLDAARVTEVRAEDISRDLCQRYHGQVKIRPSKGEELASIVRFTTVYRQKESAFWTSVNAHVYLYLVEECENNWFATDKRKFRYELTVELNGFSLNKTKALTFSQLVSENDTPTTIQAICQRCPLTWDDL